MPVHLDNPDNYDPFTILGTFEVDNFRSEDDPSDLEAALVNAIETKFEWARDAKAGRQQTVEYNKLLLKGESWIGKSRVDNAVLRIIREGDPREVRSTDNIIIDKHRAFVGKFTRAVPMTRTRPRTNEKEDIVAHEVMDSYIDYFRLSQKMRLKYKRWVEEISPSGTGFLWLRWNSEKGPIVGLCEQCDYVSRDEKPGDPCPMCAQQIQMEMAEAQQQGLAMNPQGVQQPPTLVPAREGDLEAKLVQFRDFFPDPGAKLDAETLNWAIITDAVHVSEARRMFPKRAHLIEEQSGLHSDRYIFAPSGNLANARIETRELREHCQLKMYMERPSGLHEKGRIITVIDDRIVDMQDNVSAQLLNRLPLFFARGDIDDDSLWGNDIISLAEPPQRERDILVTQCRRWREGTLNPGWIKSSRAGMHIKRLSVTSGQVVTGKHIDEANLRPIRPPQLPAYVPGELERLDIAAQTKFGVTQHERGMGDPGQSGRFAAFLDTQAAETIGPLVIEVNEEWVEIHRAAIVLAQYYMDPERIWTITSRGRVWSRSWGEANVLPGWDIYLVNVDAASRNPVIREQNARERLQLGYYTDTSTQRIDWDRFRLDAGLDLDIAGSDSEASEHMYAAELPRMVEDAIVSGQLQNIPMPMPWDNAFVMASGLLDWLRTSGKTKPEPIRRAVAMLWNEYAMSLAPPEGEPMDPEVARIMPNAQLMPNLQGQQPGMGAGGSQPGQQVGTTHGTPTAGQETAQKVKSADQRAEAVSRPQSKHES